jgi:hypothetical protein
MDRMKVIRKRRMGTRERMQESGGVEESEEETRGPWNGGDGS